MPQIYPSYGYTDLREPAFSFRWKDGSRITDLRYRSYSTYRGKRKPERLPAVLSDEDSEVLEIVLCDTLKQTEVTLVFGVLKIQCDYPVCTGKNKGEEAFYIEKFVLQIWICYSVTWI